MKKLLTLLLAVLLLAGCAGNKPGTFEAGKNTFLLNGKPFVVKAAEVHYPRIPREYWEHRIEMCKALGMNTLCLYVFLNSEAWHVRHCASWPVCMCGMGNAWSALVAVEE